MRCMHMHVRADVRALRACFACLARVCVRACVPELHAVGAYVCAYDRSCVRAWERAIVRVCYRASVLSNVCAIV